MAGFFDRFRAEGKLAAAIAAFFSAVITFLIYLPALRNGFVNWDDPEYVYESALIRSIDLKFFKTILTTPALCNWHPLTTLTYALDYSLWGLDPMGYHLVNIIFHAINTFLVFIVSVNLVNAARQAPPYAAGSSLIAGFAAALLFGLHPQHVESVAWISERKDVLCAFFYLLSVLFYLNYAKEGSKAYSYAAALLFFVLALLSKPMAVTLPLALLILDYYPLRRPNLKALIAEKIPFFALSALSALITVWVQGEGGAMMSLEEHGFLWRLVVAVRALAFYLYKMVLPFGLSPFYPLPQNTELLSLSNVLMIIGFFAIAALCLMTVKKNRVFTAAFLYYAVTLLPVLGIIQVGSQSAADRYTYLPGLGPAMLLAAGAESISRRFKKSAIAVMASIAFISAVLTGLTIRQEAIWKDTVTLWSYAIERYPGRVPMGYNNRGLAYEKAQDYAKAISDYDMAIAAYPGYTDAYLNRGIAYGEIQEYEKAFGDFNKALKLNPKSEKAYLNRGTAYMLIGDLERAEADLKASIELKPDNPIAYYNIGLIYLKAGDERKAAPYIRKASELGLREAGEYLVKHQ